MRCDYSVFVLVACWDELVEEAEEFVNLHSWEVSVVGGVFYFECVHVFAFAGHDVWQRVEARVAYRDPHCVIAFLLQEFD